MPVILCNKDIKFQAKYIFTCINNQGALSNESHSINIALTLMVKIRFESIIIFIVIRDWKSIALDFPVIIASFSILLSIAYEPEVLNKLQLYVL